ncbi:hypothetical protein F441_23005 [Phytophthora nicotianae CJ01A1]|uniref:Uncharacterized protein n=2 Tax=Phytophthora nicotianae TaxID=4792 RepID=W2VMS9_PHYNI|nr:hypothetical protein L915_22036 [Phytophthora nicotianae]ETO99579.1 hypothetical protein F441_23005 [Phytophthora nicotianae CJ01A1]
MDCAVTLPIAASGLLRLARQRLNSARISLSLSALSKPLQSVKAQRSRTSSYVVSSTSTVSLSMWALLLSRLFRL